MFVSTGSMRSQEVESQEIPPQSQAEGKEGRREMLRDRDPKHWKLFVFYYNPDSSRLFVAKRYGTPMTLNFARPMAWVIAALPLAIVVAGAVLTHLRLLR
jgi:uncharacterized membrane protein